MDSQQYATLLAAVARIEAEQKAQRQELLGNGQPGRIQRIESEISGVKKAQWIHSGSTAGILTILHQTLKHFGIL